MRTKLRENARVLFYLKKKLTLFRSQHAGRLGEAGATLAARGDVQGAVKLWLKGGRARRAATLLLQSPQLLRDNELVDAVHTQLIQVTINMHFILLAARLWLKGG